MKNTFGNIFRIHSFGESHGPAVGVVIDGMPAGVVYREDFLISDLQRRRPGRWNLKSNIGTSLRQESDTPEILSGIFQGKTLGTPIAVIIWNQDHRSSDYENLSYRKGHADEIWKGKFDHVDLRGGGRASGRETVSRVIGGSFAKMIVTQTSPQTKVIGYACQIGPLKLSHQEKKEAINQDIDDFVGRFPSLDQQKNVEDLLNKSLEQGESWGGYAEIVVLHPPKYLGQPVFNKLKNDLANALMSLGAVCGINFEDHDEKNDLEFFQGTKFHDQKQKYGGILGGISTGDSIIIRIKFKPTSSILEISKKGRHDPCIIPRAIPVLEAMTYLVLADHLLWKRLDRIE